MSKIAVVTGGAGDIGQAVVARLAKDNCQIVILDMNQEAGQQVVGDFAKRNVMLDFHCANLSDEAAVTTIFDAITAKLATLVNRAAAQPAGARTLAVLFTATYQESKNGATMLLKPKNAADLEKLQTTMAGRIEAMNRTKSCYQLASVN